MIFVNIFEMYINIDYNFGYKRCFKKFLEAKQVVC